MKRYARRYVMALLASFMLLAPTMVIEPAVSMELQLSGTGDNECGRCNCCPKAKPAQVACTLSCTYASIPATTPDQVAGILPVAKGKHHVVNQLGLPDHISTPDPPPPKSHSPH